MSCSSASSTCSSTAAKICGRCRCPNGRPDWMRHSPNYPRKDPLRLADQIHSESAELLARVCNQHLEGLVAKKIDSPYDGDRSENWLKIKCHREQEFVVGGAALSARARHRHILVAAGGREIRQGPQVRRPRRRRLRCARTRRVARALEETCAARKARSSNYPEKRSGEIWHWMKPQLVIQVAFADWTHAGILRQPRYLGLRQDRDPKTVVREEPEHTEDVVKETQRSKAKAKGKAKGKVVAAGKESPASPGRLTHPERVLFPHDGITKLAARRVLRGCRRTRDASLPGPAA